MSVTLAPKFWSFSTYDSLFTSHLATWIGSIRHEHELRKRGARKKTNVDGERLQCQPSRRLQAGAGTQENREGETEADPEEECGSEHDSETEE